MPPRCTPSQLPHDADQVGVVRTPVNRKRYVLYAPGAAGPAPPAPTAGRWTSKEARKYSAIEGGLSRPATPPRQALEAARWPAEIRPSMVAGGQATCPRSKLRQTLCEHTTASRYTLQNAQAQKLFSFSQLGREALVDTEARGRKGGGVYARARLLQVRILAAGRSATAARRATAQQRLPRPARGRRLR